MSATYYIKTKNIREKYKFPNDFNIMLDSGGWQNYKGDTGLDVIDVLRWQEANANIGYSLDYPLTENDYPMITGN